MSIKRIGLRVGNSINASPDFEKIKEYTDYLVGWLTQRVKKAHAKGIIVGISGGIDSSLVAALAKKAFPDNTLGVVMPIDSMSFDLVHIEELMKNLDLQTVTVDLKNTFDEIKRVTCVDDKMSLSNIKPRLRMTTLYALAQQHNYIVAGTDNEDELFIGYFTKHGDGGADILPISRLLKNEVRLMARYLNVPESIINKKPSAGLWEGQSDEDELGFSYADLDNYLNNNFNLINSDIKLKIDRLHKNTHHKRQKPYQPKSIKEFFKKER
ncbi:NAD(+) synthase [Mycoplasma zalophidermidis]|uniref:NH(3)-dependent NAD(+) synthetase n=1 Tax=Mycoplasma zalophidermidis TaxID=398174 RepID=A0ABS6DRA7_9MOLU|nr:NAD(+) synthase [Mycoplasma zalophidermidis]MBU4693419.1 NAD(+) synthase [Mycoplasma zalophidermidis]